MSAPEPLLPVGTRIRFEDDVEIGDFVYFDANVEPGLVLVRRLPVWEARAKSGQVFRLDAGDGPTNIKLRRVRFCSPGEGVV
jgi:hypothetical protein